MGVFGRIRRAAGKVYRVMVKGVKGAIGLLQIALGAVVLIVSTVIGFYVVTQIDQSITIDQTSAWYQPYTQFISMMQNVFIFVGIAALVSVVGYVIATLMGLTGRQ